MHRQIKRCLQQYFSTSERVRFQKPSADQRDSSYSLDKEDKWRHMVNAMTPFVHNIKESV